MIYDEPGLTKKLYSQMPHSTWDNHFSGDKIMDYAGERGFGLKMTCRRDQHPKYVPSTYWHKERTDSSQTCKVARFFNPVVSVKDVISHEKKKAYRRVHVSFQ